MKKYFILAAVALTMAACSNSNDEGGKVNAPSSESIRLKTMVAGANIGGTRADGTDIQTANIENGQSVWAEFSTTATTYDVWTGTTTSDTYTADGSGNLSGGSVKWPKTTAGTETVAITAWAPATAAPASWTVANTWSVKTDQTAKADYLASDLLYGTSASFTHDDIANPILVTFEHKLAKINVKIAGGTDTGGNALAASDLANAKIVFAEGSEAAPTTPYLITDATIAGSTVTKGTTTGAITVTTAYNTSENASAVIIPQTVEATSTAKKILFSVTLASDLTKTYLYKIGANKEFKAGYEYTYNITIRGDQNLIILTEQITKWTDGGSEAIIAG